MVNTVSIDDVIKVLNDALNHDRVVIQNVIESRVPCSDSFIEHPSIQVGHNHEGHVEIGIIGIINSLFGTDDNGYGPGGTEYDGGGQLCSFVKMWHDTDLLSRLAGSEWPVY
ncbi:hypothetical protein ACIQZG_24335 [Lysinibacillus sp. NPDC096418]|uniref:hypothetical protein n=1 Tax=Lysinibacillus sp. NPDC096418 TaxID=3364138 RepID=UPI0037FDF845